MLKLFIVSSDFALYFKILLNLFKYLYDKQIYNDANKHLWKS